MTDNTSKSSGEWLAVIACSLDWERYLLASWRLYEMATLWPSFWVEVETHLHSFLFCIFLLWLWCNDWTKSVAFIFPSVLWGSWGPGTVPYRAGLSLNSPLPLMRSAKWNLCVLLDSVLPTLHKTIKVMEYTKSIPSGDIFKRASHNSSCQESRDWPLGCRIKYVTTMREVSNTLKTLSTQKSDQRLLRPTAKDRFWEQIWSVFQGGGCKSRNST